MSIELDQTVKDLIDHGDAVDIGKTRRIKGSRIISQRSLIRPSDGGLVCDSCWWLLRFPCFIAAVTRCGREAQCNEDENHRPGKQATALCALFIQSTAWRGGFTAPGASWEPIF